MAGSVTNKSVDVVTCGQAKHWSMGKIEKVENLFLSTAKVQWRQSSWKVSSAHAQVDIAAQTTTHAVRTVCVAYSCAYVMAMKTVTIHILLAT